MIDFNAKLGQWPYRPMRGIEALLETIEAFEMEWAVVSSLSAVHYLNPHDGNEELAKLIEPHRDCLIPFAVLKPHFALCEKDLEKCVAEYGMKGLVLYPNYHQFDLTDPSLRPLMEQAGAYGLPVCIQVGLEDPRRQFDRPLVPEVAAETVGAFARQYPEIQVVVLGLKFGQPEKMGESLPPNLKFDISNYEHLGELEYAVQQFGASCLLFGTNFPLFTPSATIEKIRCAVLSEGDRRLITHLNARHLLGL